MMVYAQPPCDFRNGFGAFFSGTAGFLAQKKYNRDVDFGSLFFPSQFSLIIGFVPYCMPYGRNHVLYYCYPFNYVAISRPILSLYSPNHSKSLIGMGRCKG